MSAAGEVANTTSPWLTFLASGGGALLGGLFGAFAGWLGARWTSVNARRDQVWKRVEWALSKVLEDDARAQQLGSVALLEIIEGDLADKRDIKIITALSTAAFEDLEADIDVEHADFVVVGDDEQLPPADQGETDAAADQGETDAPVDQGEDGRTAGSG